MATASYGGDEYSFANRDIESDKYTCNICTNVLEDPHLTVCCGQHFCESCLERWFRKNHKESCPHCRAEGENIVHVLDKSIKREIDSLRIHCTNKEEGCEWIGELGSLKDHLESANGCGYVEVECTNGCINTQCYTSAFICMYCSDYNLAGGASCDTCGAAFPKIKTTLQVKVKRKDLENHLKDDCPLRPYPCRYCGHITTYENVNDHYQQCREYLIGCPNKCGVRSIKRKNVSRHRGKCLKELVQCPFEEAGCKEKVVRCKLAQHILANQERHRQMMKKLQLQISRLTEENMGLQEDLAQEKSRSNREKSQLSDENLRLHQKNFIMEQDISTARQDLRSTERQLDDKEQKLKFRCKITIGAVIVAVIVVLFLCLIICFMIGVFLDKIEIDKHESCAHFTYD